MLFSFFFFNDTATTEIYTLSLHDALPISIIESYEKRGLSDPKIIEGENYVKIILPRVLKKKNISTEQKKLIELFALSSEITIEDVQRILGVSRQTASRKMNRFIEKGIVERIGKTRATRYRIREHKGDV